MIIFVKALYGNRSAAKTPLLTLCSAKLLNKEIFSTSNPELNVTFICYSELLTSAEKIQWLKDAYILQKKYSG